MDCYLKFHEHTNLTVTKANRVLGLIRKTFNCREPDMIKTFQVTDKTNPGIRQFNMGTSLCGRSTGN